MIFENLKLMNFTDFWKSQINEFNFPFKKSMNFWNLKLMNFTVKNLKLMNFTADQKSQINEFDWEKILK